MRQALRAHEFWLRNGFEADLVILNEYPGGYIQPVQDELEEIVGASHAHQMMNKPGGVYVQACRHHARSRPHFAEQRCPRRPGWQPRPLDAQLDREMPEPASASPLAAR